MNRIDNRIISWVCLLAVWLIPWMAQASTHVNIPPVKPLQIDVFTRLGVRVTGLTSDNGRLATAHIHIYRVDQYAQLTRKLNRLLRAQFRHSGRDGIASLAKQWIQAHQAAYQQQGEMIDRITRYRIHRLPAIVFNHQLMVFGTTNILVAYHIYQRHQSKLSRGMQ